MVRMPGSSPPSSEATHYGTPSTNITAMSPDACNSSGRIGTAPRFNLRINTNQQRSTIRAHNMTRNLHLPQASPAQLSPTAEEFTPRTASFNIPPHMAAFRSQGVSPVRNLVVGSMPDFHNAQLTAHGAIGQASATINITNVNAEVQLGSNIHVVWGSFSTDENVTRTFEIYDKNGPSLHHIIHRFPTQFDTLACIDSKHIEQGIIRLSFHDDRDAKQAYVLAASMTHPRCNLRQLTAKDVAVAHGRDPSTVTNYEGQLLLYEKLAVFGHVKALISCTPTIANSIAFRIEYSNVIQAKQAAKYLPQASQGNVQYSVTLYEPDIFYRTQRSSPTAITPRRNNGQPSLTGRSTVPSGDFARLENVMARIMREPPSPYRGVARIGHNVVDIARIEAGLDVRTTIMLRNIPNRVDQDALKDLLDRTSFGEFDFMYLRIDFANNCNVGYAFINFVDPLAIVAFARARAGKRWFVTSASPLAPDLTNPRNIFSSDKVAEISYATIQGRDCLIQKFRNSSVMLEHPTYRPKLYYTHPSLEAGTEEIFPEPDNYSKMRRSIDNAEHVGLYRPGQGNGPHSTPPASAHTQELSTSIHSNTSTPLTWSSSTASSSTNSGLFAPREGQAHREEQRRRRSQFHRGSPGAGIELSRYRLTDAAFDGPHPRFTPSAHIGGVAVEDPALTASRLAFQGLHFF